jgi:hypothetical protein
VNQQYVGPSCKAGALRGRYWAPQKD